MTPNQEKLTPRQRVVLNAMARLLTEKEFYLAGGVALALRLGHRHSVDLDWFRRAAIDDPLGFSEDLRQHGVRHDVTSAARDTLYLDVSGVQVSMMSYRYPLLEPAEAVEGIGCDVASIEDIACMKLSAIVGRSEKKDYFDLASIARQGYDLGDLLIAYQRKMGTNDITSPLLALTYFNDVDKQRSRIREIDRPGAWEQTKDTLRAWVRTLDKNRSLYVDLGSLKDEGRGTK